MWNHKSVMEEMPSRCGIRVNEHCANNQISRGSFRCWRPSQHGASLRKNAYGVARPFSRWPAGAEAEI
jgi:hypothetical protein